MGKSAVRRSAGTGRTKGGASTKSSGVPAKKQSVAGRAKSVAGSAGSQGDAMVSRAISELAAAGRLTGARSEKISARVDPGVMEAAAERLGLPRTDVSDVVNAALALAAAPDRFKTWLRTTEDTLPGDFELAV